MAAKSKVTTGRERKVFKVLFYFCIQCSTISSKSKHSQSSEQAPFTSEYVQGSILATDLCEKSQSTLCRKSWVFSGCSGFLPQEKLTWWVRINTVKNVISQLL
jgi:hypothetical protein